MRRLLPILALGVLLAGCVETRFLPTTTATTYPPRPANYPIEFLSAVPDRAYIELGHVSAVGCTACSTNYISEKLRARVRQAGGDAVINLQVYTAPAGTVGAGGLTIQGTAVRWRE